MKSIVFIIAALLLWGCSTDSVDYVPPAEDVPPEVPAADVDYGPDADIILDADTTWVDDMYSDVGLDLETADGLSADTGPAADTQLEDLIQDSDAYAEDIAPDCEALCVDLECGPAGPSDECQCGICDDGNVCTDDLCLEGGTCSSGPAEVGTECDDGDPCTDADACVDSTCVGTALVCDCEVDEDCAQFDDGNICTGTLICDVSTAPYKCSILGSSVIICPPPTPGPDAKCKAATCDAYTGACGVGPVDDGESCDDGDPCTAVDSCLAGVCAGVAQPCDDSNPCTDDACDPSGDCVFESNDTNICDDGNPCTAGDACVNGACTGEPMLCDDGNQCTNDSCHPFSGCIFVTDVENPCDDEDICTIGDSCASGSCQASGPNLCDDLNPCTDDVCVPGDGCVHADNLLPCDDGDPCLLGDSCVDGVCEAGPDILSCDDGDDCTEDACVTQVGCMYETVDDGASCVADMGTCLGGVCEPAGIYGWCDSFTSPDSDVIEGYQEFGGNWQLVSGRVETSEVGWNYLTRDIDDKVDGVITARVSLLPGTNTRAAGVVGRFGGTKYSQLLFKVQDSYGFGYFDSYFVYEGLTPLVKAQGGQNFGTEAMIQMEYDGPLVTYRIDEDLDGVWDLVGTTSTDNVAYGGTGLHSYGSVALDDFCVD